MTEEQKQPSESIVSLIKKCLALAHSSNEHEAAAAMSKAQELLEKYNLSMSDVSSPEFTKPEMIDGAVPDVDPSSSLRELYDVIARHNYCRCIGHPHSHISILGRLSNVEATVEMVGWLEEQIQSLVNKEMKGWKNYVMIDGRIQTRTESKENYRTGFYRGIVKRIDDMMKESSNSRQFVNSDIKAMVIRLDKETAEFVHEVYPNLRTVGRASVSTSAFQKGYAAGEGVSCVRPSHRVGGGSLSLGSG